MAKIRDLRLEPMGGSAAAMSEFVADETRLWGLIMQAHVTLQ